MARGKVVTKTYTTKKVPTKSGQYKYKKVLDKKTVTKASNQAKGAGVQRVFNTDQAKLKAAKIQSAENIEKSKIAGRTADIATISAAAAQTLSKGFGSIPQGSTEIRDTSKMHGVDQLIQGGASEAYNNRNDDEDNPFID